MPSEFDLDTIGVIEGTDKSSSVGISWDYLRQYAQLFARFCDAPTIVIDIGSRRAEQLLKLAEAAAAVSPRSTTRCAPAWTGCAAA